MRILASACVALCLLVGTAQAAEIKTGRDLVNACRDYMSADSQQDNNALQPNACRTFLQGFFVSLVERQRARQDAMVKGLPYASKEPCVRMPDFLSYKEMAGRIVTYASNNPGAMDEAAAIVAQKTLEHDFPCPAQGPAPR
jgi:hypothetical protein